MYGAKHGEEIPFGVSFFLQTKKHKVCLCPKCKLTGYILQKIQKIPR